MTTVTAWLQILVLDIEVLYPIRTQSLQLDTLQRSHYLVCVWSSPLPLAICSYEAWCYLQYCCSSLIVAFGLNPKKTRSWNLLNFTKKVLANGQRRLGNLKVLLKLWRWCLCVSSLDVILCHILWIETLMLNSQSLCKPDTFDPSWRWLQGKACEGDLGQEWSWNGISGDYFLYPIQWILWVDRNVDLDLILFSFFPAGSCQLKAEDTEVWTWFGKFKKVWWTEPCTVHQHCSRPRWFKWYTHERNVWFLKLTDPVV